VRSGTALFLPLQADFRLRSESHKLSLRMTQIPLVGGCRGAPRVDIQSGMDAPDNAVFNQRFPRQ